MIQGKEKLKIDCALPAQALTGNDTSAYFDMAGFKSGMYILNVAVMARDVTAKIEVFGSDAADGGSAALVASHAATITSPVKMTVGYVHVNSPSNDDTLTVNGVVFTKKAEADAAAREFNLIAELVAQINSDVPGVTAAVDNTNYVLLTSTNPGEKTITLVGSNTTRLNCSGKAAVAFVEALETCGKRYLAAKVTVSAETSIAVDLVRSLPKHKPVDQATGAHYPS